MSPIPAKFARGDSFEAWGAIVPHVLVWIDLPDPQKTREGLEDEDPFHRAIGVVVTQWLPLVAACGFADRRGLSIREALNKLYDLPFLFSGEKKTCTDDLRDALETLAPGRGCDKVDARNLGHVFRRAMRRVIDGRKARARRHR